MEARSLRFIATACAGEQLNGSPETRVHRVTTDSRQTQAGDLFFALPGGRFDGHDFLRQAAEQGAGAVVVERKRVPAGWSGFFQLKIYLIILALPYREFPIVLCRKDCPGP